QAALTSATGAGPSRVLAADLDGDGTTDLVTFHSAFVPPYNDPNFYDGTATLSILIGNGDSTFQPAQTVPLGGSVVSVAVGDLNADGKLDLVARVGTPYSILRGYDGETGEPFYDYYDDVYVDVLIGNGDGTFGPVTEYYLGTVWNG